MATSLTRVKGEVKANTIFDLTFDSCQKCSKSNFSSRASEQPVISNETTRNDFARLFSFLTVFKHLTLHWCKMSQKSTRKRLRGLNSNPVKAKNTKATGYIFIIVFDRYWQPGGLLVLIFAGYVWPLMTVLHKVYTGQQPNDILILCNTLSLTTLTLTF